jgi:hypothetical protein
VSCVSRVDSLSAIITNYSKIYESLIKIEGKSSGDAKSKASGHLRMLEVLSFLKPLTLFLQKKNCDMVVAFDEAQNTLNMLKRLRTDEKILELFARAQIIAVTMEVVLQPRRRVSSPRFLCRPTTLYIFARAVGRQSAIHTENCGFASPTLGQHISTFRGYRILFSIRNPYINRFINHFSIHS